MVCANAGYLVPGVSNPSTGVRRANYFYSRTEKSSAQRFEIKIEDMGTTPNEAMGVGYLTTIHRASKSLPQVVWYVQCIQKTHLNAWIRKKPKRLQLKWWTYNTITTTKTTQGTADGDKNVVARILAWQYAEDIDKLARTQDTYVSYLYWVR